MRRTPDDLREYADEHLWYEIQMTADLTARLARHARLFEAGLDPSTDGNLASELLEPAGRNADIESWVTHVSNVFNFLLCNRKHADVVAYEFFDRHHDWTELLPRRPDSLERLNARVPIEIDHLSYGRTKVRDKTWAYEQIWGDLAELVRLFADNVPEGRVSSDFLSGVKALLPAEDVIEEVRRLRHEATNPEVGVTSTATTIPSGGTATWTPPPGERRIP